VEVQVFSAAPKINMDEDININKKKFSPEESVELITNYLENYQNNKIFVYLKEMHNADIADLIQNLDPVLRLSLINIISNKFDPEILTYLNDSLRDEIVETLDIKQLANNAKELDIDDAVDLVEDLEKEDQNTFLENLEAEERTLIEEGLNYPEDSAGRLMQRQFVALDLNWNVGQAIDYLRSNKNKLPEDFYDIFLINNSNKVMGVVPLGRLMGSKRDVDLETITNKETRLIDVNTDQEEVAYLFSKYGLVSAAVIDENEKIIGSITVDDVVDVIEEEREEDILKLGGVGHTDIYNAVIDTTKSRFSWLLVNLLTAVVASIVIGFFEASIEKVVALAILMPIVASMGGNAGTQTLTVAVRALAVKELTTSNALKIITKETFIGGINGIIFAIIISLVSMYWFQDLMLGIIIGLAMVLNLIVAGFAGTIIPLTLDKLKIDPALASGVILTTITDVFGFLSFLGLATLFLI
jgi:magnesium transporter